jgi:hypothetical protein
MVDLVAVARNRNEMPELARQKLRYQLLWWIWMLQGDEFGQTGLASAQHRAMTRPNLSTLISKYPSRNIRC